jgi:hypothetical protein
VCLCQVEQFSTLKPEELICVPVEECVMLKEMVNIFVECERREALMEVMIYEITCLKEMMCSWVDFCWPSELDFTLFRK